MEIIPAVDIRGGHCVRLHQGDYAAETVFDDDPAAAARRWFEVGAPRLHVVDLDGARSGEPVQFDLVAAIIRAGTLASVPVQVGGGIRTVETVQRYIDVGVTRVILGTAAVRDAALVRQLCAAHGDAVVVSIDARDGYVAVAGWTETSEVRAVDLAHRLTDLGLERLVYTDIARDGTLTEPNYAALTALTTTVTVPVIASGGVADVAQIGPLAATGVEAIIIGRALYDGRLDLAAAIAATQAIGASDPSGV